MQGKNEQNISKLFWTSYGGIAPEDKPQKVQNSSLVSNCQSLRTPLPHAPAPHKGDVRATVRKALSEPRGSASGTNFATY
jgi:hypothetical protein